MLSPIAGRRFAAALIVLSFRASSATPAQTTEPAVAFGRAHAVALATTGEVLTWGANLYCQLGRGGLATTPRPVLRNAIAIAVADDHTLALSAEGRVYGWGMNSSGALGTGSTDDVCQGPVLIESLADKTIAHIATGKDFSVAVTEAGDLYCAGSNDVGQCPAPRTDPSVFAPLAIPGLAGNVKAVAAGFFHTLVLTRDGRLHTFGRGREGQLGNGKSVNTRTLSGSAVVPGLSDVVAVAAGIWHSAAVRADGSVWLWGSNHESQLCDGTTTSRALPAPLRLGADARFTEVAAGGHTTLLRTSDGTLFGCGNNLDGALGSSQPRVVREPARIASQTRARPIALSQRNAGFSTDGCRVSLAGENTGGIVRPGSDSGRMPFTARADLSLCGARVATALPAIVSPPPRGGQSGCWAPNLVESSTQPAFATVNRAMLAAVEILGKQAALLAPPEPARMRAHLSAGAHVEDGASLHVTVVPERKADGTRLWTAGCGVTPHLERIGGAILQVTVSFNRSLVAQSGTPPERTGQLGPYPEYNDTIVITRDGRLPWIPETLADQLDREAERRRQELDDWNRAQAFLVSTRAQSAELERQQLLVPVRTAMLEEQVRAVERYRASFDVEQLRAPAVLADTSSETERRHAAELAELRKLPPVEQQRVDALARERRVLETEAREKATSSEDAARLRARAADLARQARALQTSHMERASIAITAATNRHRLERLRPGTADRAVRVKPDPSWSERARPDRLHVILVHVSRDPNATQTVRGAWQQHVKATLDVAALATLLR